MIHPIYNRQQLERMKRPQLWAICEEIGVHRFAKIVDLVGAILEKMPQLVQEVEEIIVQAESKPEAEIINDAEDYEPWALVSGGAVITRGKTYLQVFNSPSAKGFEIINIDNQTCFNSLAVWQDVQAVIEQASVEEDEYIDPETSRLNTDEPAIVVAPPQSRKKGLSIAFVCEFNDEKLYAVNFDGVLIGYFCERGSGRRDFFAPAMLANNQRTVKSLSADRRLIKRYYWMPIETDQQIER
jgi:hypothetical protein